MTFCFTCSTTVFAATKDLSGVNATSSDGDYKFTIRANAEQLDKINSIKNKDIKMSRLEFFTEVFPDVAKHFSTHQRELYSEIDYSLPETSDTSNNSNTIQPQGIILGVTYSTISQNDDRSISFGTYAVTTEKVDYFLIDSYLRDNDENFVDYACTDDGDTSHADASGVHDDPDAGTYYRTEGEIIVFKADATPNTVTQYRNSNWLEAQ